MSMDVQDYEKIFKALANRRRLEILLILREKKKVSVGVLATKIKLSFKSTSKHLSVLFGAGIVEREQIVLTVNYSLSSRMSSFLKSIISRL